MKKLILIGVLVAVSFLLVGYGGYVDRIPNGGVDSCDACHSEDMSMNSFGEDFDTNGREWNADLAVLDSDGGSEPNGYELLDPNGDWTEGDEDPGDPADVDNPGDSSDDDDDWGVESVSWGQIKADQ